MSQTLQEITMEYVLHEGLSYSYLRPHGIVGNLTKFFFGHMFVNMAERCEELAMNLIDPDADEEDTAELMRILKTFAAVKPECENIKLEERFVSATADLIHAAEYLVDIVDNPVFIEFLSFVESLVVLFIDDSFLLQSHKDYTVEVLLYHIRHAQH